jgi:hypothetical protein
MSKEDLESTQQWQRKMLQGIVTEKRLTIANWLTIIGMAGGLIVAWNQLSAQSSNNARDIKAAVERAKEDREDFRKSLDKIDAKVQRTEENVQLILQELKAMEALRRADRRRDRGVE